MATRIERVQRSLLPKEGVRSRYGYASLDYLAERIGAPNRQAIMPWINKGKEPSEKYRKRLANLSQGVYSPDDFRVRFPRQEYEQRLAAVEDGLADLRELVEKQLEARRPRTQAQPQQKAGP